jgi:hypothetical protein
MSGDVLSVKPEVVFIEDLFDEFEGGDLRIPRFQRPYVWPPSDMLALFDSISQGYPIGSLLFWETSENIASAPYVGPFQAQTSSRKSATYILDGHQRLATLFGALRLPKNAPRGPSQLEWRWRIWFDLKTREFTHLPKGDPLPHYFPLGAILRTVDFLEEARRVQLECEEDALRFIPEAERLAQQIKTYKIPVTRIRGGQLSRAVEIFSRLNTRGQDMAIDQMVSALTYREGVHGFDLAVMVDEILESLATYNFGTVKRLTIVRAIVAATGNDIYKTKWETLAKRFETAQLESIVRRCGEALLQAAKFLTTEVGVIGERFLPYSNQLLLLSLFFFRCAKPTSGQLQFLTRWFWVSSFSGWFAGANTTQISLAISDIARLADGQLDGFSAISTDDPATPIPQNFDMRSARIRSLLLVLLAQRPIDPATNKPLSASDIIGGSDAPTLTHIFPRASQALVSHPANRIFLKKPPGLSMREFLVGVPPDIEKLVLESHAISPAALQALVQNDGDKFIVRRAEEFRKIETAFMQLIGVRSARPSVPHPSSSLAEIESDTDA